MSEKTTNVEKTHKWKKKKFFDFVPATLIFCLILSVLEVGTSDSSIWGQVTNSKNKNFFENILKWKKYGHTKIMKNHDFLDFFVLRLLLCVYENPQMENFKVFFLRFFIFLMFFSYFWSFSILRLYICIRS